MRCPMLNELANGFAPLHRLVRHHVAIVFSLDRVADQREVVDREADIVNLGMGFEQLGFYQPFDGDDFEQTLHQANLRRL
jgi:hypothetical protein